MSSKKCPVGKIRRKESYVEPYTRADGTRVKGHYRKSVCVEDRGKPGKTPKSKRVLPQPKKNGLSKYGYSTKKIMNDRREALRKAVRSEGYAYVIRRLNLLANFNENQNPRVANTMRRDISWIQSNLKSSNRGGVDDPRGMVQKKSIMARPAARKGNFGQRDDLFPIINRPIQRRRNMDDLRENIGGGRYHGYGGGNGDYTVEFSPLAKKASSKKAPAKKGWAKKAPAKKGWAKKAPKKAPAKKSSAKKAPPKKAPAKKGWAKRLNRGGVDDPRVRNVRIDTPPRPMRIRGMNDRDDVDFDRALFRRPIGHRPLNRRGLNRGAGGDLSPIRRVRSNMNTTSRLRRLERNSGGCMFRENVGGGKACM